MTRLSHGPDWISLRVRYRQRGLTHFVLLLSRDRIIVYEPCDYFRLIVINRLVNERYPGWILSDGQLFLWFFRHDPLSFYQGTSRNRLVSLGYLRLRDRTVLFFVRYIMLSWNSSYQVIRESLQEDTGSKIRRMFAQQTCAASLQHDIFELLELPAYQPILQRRRIHFWSCERSFSIDKTHFLDKRRCVFLTNISFRVILTNYYSI